LLLTPRPAANKVEQSIAMNDSSNTTAGLDQADEEILTYTVSDEALEAVAGTEGGPFMTETYGTLGSRVACPTSC
jgi:hypothetical protein